MGELCRLIVLEKNELVLRCFWIVLFPLLFGGISLGSLYFYYNANEYHTQEIYTNTSCVLLNYTFIEYECQTCPESCYTHVCFYENFIVSYITWNKTLVKTSLITDGTSSKHKQVELGSHYSCFYKRKNITSIMWDLPDEKASLNILYISFIIALLCLLFIIVVVWFRTMKKRSKVAYEMQDVPTLTEAFVL